MVNTAIESDDDYFQDGTQAAEEFSFDDEHDDRSDDDKDDGVMQAEPSALRVQNASVALTEGVYTGQKSSRAQVDDLSTVDGGIQWNSDDDENDDELATENEEQEEEEVDSGEAAEDMMQLMRNFEQQDQVLFNKSANNEEEAGASKAQHVLNQKKIWEDLLEIQIFVKRLVSSINSSKSPSSETPMLECLSTLMQCQSILAGSKTTLNTSTTNLDDLWEALSSFQNTQMAQYDTTLKTWSAKTSSGGSKKESLKVVDQSIMAQVEAVLSDPDRVCRKAHGAVSTEDDSIDTSTYDDFEFYKELLKEYIDNGNSGMSALSRVKRKRKKKQSSKISKGRRLQYDVHPKLQNFMFPDPVPTMSNSSELFKSLFA